VGITAGTSTPDTLIAQVEQWLAARARRARGAPVSQSVAA
jgi:4-hydroxy-3-methylbut-2-enyl diphosphate reductase IspH